MKQKGNKNRKEQRGAVTYSESVRTKWFCCSFNLGFLQLPCKASLNFKSKLELALTIILKEKELYKSKHVVVECRLQNYETSYPFWYVPLS